MRRCPLIALAVARFHGGALIALVLAPAVARFHGCPLVALVLAPAVARFQGGEVDSGAVEPWVRDLAELCPPGADAPCEFRERPGCRDGLRGRYGLPERAFADRALPIATPENARLFPPRFDARGGWALRRRQRAPPLPAHPEERSTALAARRRRGPGWHCGRAYKLEAPGSRARFEAFVREVLPEDFDPARLDDAISYHVASQASAVSPYRRFDFVGRLETLRASVLSLSLAVDDPERYASRLAGLLVQKHARPRGANGTAPQASRADAGCLSNETRRLILARLGQDYRCFGYDAAYLEGGVRASRCSEVRW
ncbi:hypothetical protein JL720_5260 [Aureococcus anophagefferens]|nr:hypothetical protein JL720_5260 [Aureococcus anophagefferens]